MTSSGGVWFDDGDRYIDWSTPVPGGRRFDVGEGAEAVVVEFTWAEIEQVRDELTLLLGGR